MHKKKPKKLQIPLTADSDSPNIKQPETLTMPKSAQVPAEDGKYPKRQESQSMGKKNTNQKADELEVEFTYSEVNEFYSTKEMRFIRFAAPGEWLRLKLRPNRRRSRGIGPTRRQTILPNQRRMSECLGLECRLSRRSYLLPDGFPC